MFRTSATRAVPASLTALRVPVTGSTILRASLKTSTRPVKSSRILALAVRQPLQQSLVRYASDRSKIVGTRDVEGEKRRGEEKVVAIPDLVSTGSSVHPVVGEVGADQADQDVDMAAGIKSDFVSESELW